LEAGTEADAGRADERSRYSQLKWEGDWTMPMRRVQAAQVLQVSTREV
jgi:hypothetical protein